MYLYLEETRDYLKTSTCVLKYLFITRYTQTFLLIEKLTLICKIDKKLYEALTQENGCLHSMGKLEVSDTH